MYKKVLTTIALAFIMYYGCNSKEQDNAKLIRSIDNIKKVDTLYTILVDSNNVVVDTLLMFRQKKNKEGGIVFTENISMNDKQKITSKKYYREDNELFYQISETRNSEIYISTYENWVGSGRIRKSMSIFKHPENIDTILMTYKYEEGKDGKIKKLIIYEQQGKPIVEAYYNEFEKPVQEIFLYEGDTTEIINYTYKEGNLFSEKKHHISSDARTESIYTSEKTLFSRKEYIKDSLVSEEVFKRDSKGNMLVRKIK